LPEFIFTEPDCHCSPHFIPIGRLGHASVVTGFCLSGEYQLVGFIVAGTLALVIAFATVSAQAIRAALMNPAESLKSE
jgi:putative ABC transport system permease protein